MDCSDVQNAPITWFCLNQRPAIYLSQPRVCSRSDDRRDHSRCSHRLACLGARWLLAYPGAEHPEFENFRLHVEIFGLTYPDTFIDLNEANANEGWERVIDQAFMFAVDHHPLDEWPGFHYSAGFNIQSSTITRKGLTGETSFSTFELLLTVGYRFKPVDTWELFVTPYAAIGLPMEISTPDELGGQVFEEPFIQWVGSVRVGWTFPL